MMCGIWGTLSLGLFAAGKYGAPTPTGADTSTVVTAFSMAAASACSAQMIGSFSITIATFIVSMALMYEYVVTGEDGCPKTVDDVPIGRRTGTRLPKIGMKKAS